MLERTGRPLADEERVALLERRNVWTAAPERARRGRWLWTLMGTVLSLGVGLLLAAFLRSCGAPETVARLAAIVAATAASVFAYEGARQMQRSGLQAAITRVTAIDRVLTSGEVAVTRVQSARCARLTLDEPHTDETVGFLFDIGADGVYFVRGAEGELPERFPADRFERADGDGTGVIDEDLAVTGEPVAPVASLVCADELYELLCDGSVYGVLFDAAVENPAALTDAAKA